MEKHPITHDMMELYLADEVLALFKKREKLEAWVTEEQHEDLMKTTDIANLDKEIQTLSMILDIIQRYEKIHTMISEPFELSYIASVKTKNT